MFLKLIKKITIFLFLVNPALAFHDVEVSNEEIATLGGLWVQIFVYEENCIDNQYYTLITERLQESPRFERYSSELDHLTEELSNKELGQLITEATIYLECWMSVAKIRQIIEEGERQKAFFSEYK